MIHDHFTMKNITTNDHAFVFRIMNHDSWPLFKKNIATTSDHATNFRIMNYDSCNCV